MTALIYTPWHLNVQKFMLPNLDLESRHVVLSAAYVRADYKDGILLGLQKGCAGKARAAQEK